MEFNSKNNFILLIGIAVFTVFNLFGRCGTKKLVKRNAIEIETNRYEQDSISSVRYNNVYTKDEADLVSEIEGYKLSERLLYDMNYIILTKDRPDARMREYTLIRDALYVKLDSLQARR